MMQAPPGRLRSSIEFTNVGSAVSANAGMVEAIQPVTDSTKVILAT
jgi:hypothetical protein